MRTTTCDGSRRPKPVEIGLKPVKRRCSGNPAWLSHTMSESCKVDMCEHLHHEGSLLKSTKTGFVIASTEIPAHLCRLDENAKTRPVNTVLEPCYVVVRSC